MLRNYVIPYFQQRQCLGQTIFMQKQDGAPSDSSLAGRALLGQHFTDERIISSFLQNEWPFCSLDASLKLQFYY